MGALVARVLRMDHATLIQFREFNFSRKSAKIWRQFTNSRKESRLLEGFPPIVTSYTNYRLVSQLMLATALRPTAAPHELL
jgi:hypothetical protein